MAGLAVVIWFNSVDSTCGTKATIERIGEFPPVGLHLSGRWTESANWLISRTAGEHPAMNRSEDFIILW